MQALQKIARRCNWKMFFNEVFHPFLQICTPKTPNGIRFAFETKSANFSFLRSNVFHPQGGFHGISTGEAVGKVDLLLFECCSSEVYFLGGLQPDIYLHILTHIDIYYTIHTYISYTYTYIWLQVSKSTNLLLIPNSCHDCIKINSDKQQENKMTPFHLCWPVQIGLPEFPQWIILMNPF